jgi:hypothetical protein
MRLRSALFASLVSAALATTMACSKSSSPVSDDPPSEGTTTPPDTTPPSGNPTSGALSASIEKRFQDCLPLASDPTADPVTEASFHAARAAIEAGETDVALSEKGCTRFVADKTKRLTAVYGLPYGIAIAKDGSSVSYVASSIVVTETDTGSVTEGDLDADGLIDLRDTVVNGTSRTLEHFDKQGAVVARSKAVPASDNRRITVTDEGLVKGKLSPTKTYDTAKVAQKCDGDPPPGAPPPSSPTNTPKAKSPFPQGPSEVACSADQRAKVDALLERAARNGTTCLGGANLPELKFRLLRELATKSFVVKCTDSDDFVAAMDGAYGRLFPGRTLLWVNVKLFTGSEAEQEGTLFHELLHFFEGHDGDVEALADGSTNLGYADRVYACERLCYSSKANRCHLAACQGKKVCEVDPSAFERTTGKKLEACWSGHQVGALCRKAPGQRQWCTTAAECDAACGQPCESKSISCNESCR